VRTRAWILGALLLAPLVSGRAGAGEDPPAGFKRHLPRGQIPALDDPQFVTAAEADTLPDDWVLGVLIDGEARAYELNLLTRHEVINDRFGDEPVAVVWCPLANSAAVFDRRVAGRELSFEPSGVLMHGSIVLQDRQTDSFWPLLHEQSLYGPLEGTSLVRLPGATKARFRDWVREHPDTLVWSWNGMEHLGKNPMVRYLNSAYGFKGEVAKDDCLETKTLVFGFELDGQPLAAAAEDLEGGVLFAVGERSLLLYRRPGADRNSPTLAFVSKAGFRRERDTWVANATGARFDPWRGFPGPGGPKRLLGFDTFWYVWSLNHPDTALLVD